MNQRLNDMEQANANRTQDNPLTQRNSFAIALILIITIAGFYWLGRYNYPLFHSLADLITVFIATGVSVLVWNRRRLIDNHYYLFMGIAFLFFAFWDLLHLLGNKGMGIFPEYGNMGPTLYIVSRYILSLSLLIAPWFIRRKLNTTIAFAGYIVVTLLLVLSIFYWQNFPATFIEGVGLTSFKVISDYIICAILLGSITLLVINRRSFDAKVLKQVIISLILSIGTGLAFTLYIDPFGVTNSIGHFLQIASFYLIYAAFMETIMVKPQDILYRNLKQSEEKVLKLNVDLEKDITERKKAVEALKESERKLIGVLESMPDAFVSFDSSLRYTYINSNAERLQAARREELLGRDIKTVYPDAESAKTISLYEQVVREQKPITSTSYHAGFKRWVEIRAFPTPDGVSVFYKDVSAQVKAEQALRESEEKYRSLTENLPDIITRYDRDLRHIFVNTAAGNATGLPPQAFIGKTNQELGMDSEQVDFWMKHVRNVFATGKPETMDFQWMAPDGLRYHQTIITPEFDNEGTVKTVLCVTHNLTELKRTEEALRQYSSDLEAANKELESFSYSVSHDLRAPLRSLDGYSGALLEDYIDKLDDQGKKWLQNIRSSSQYMGQLIDDILGLSRVIRAEMKFEKVDLSGIAQSVAIKLKETEPDRQVEFVIASGIEVAGDRNLLELVLQNLEGNAYKFTSKTQAPRIEFGANLQYGEKVYFVRDNGIGFDMKFVDKLFKPFQRLHSNKEYPGTGIGLATVQRIIHRHGGKIWVEGEVNRGATFYFTLNQEK